MSFPSSRMPGTISRTAASTAAAPAKYFVRRTQTRRARPLTQPATRKTHAVDCTDLNQTGVPIFVPRALRRADATQPQLAFTINTFTTAQRALRALQHPKSVPCKSSKTRARVPPIFASPATSQCLTRGDVERLKAHYRLQLAEQGCVLVHQSMGTFSPDHA
jgi:hypothetical protein